MKQLILYQDPIKILQTGFGSILGMVFLVILSIFIPYVRGVAILCIPIGITLFIFSLVKAVYISGKPFITLNHEGIIIGNRELIKFSDIEDIRVVYTSTNGFHTSTKLRLKLANRRKIRDIALDDIKNFNDEEAKYEILSFMEKQGFNFY